MKKLTLGIVTAAALLTAAPAMAQVGFYAGPGGVGVQLGGPGYYDSYAGYPYNGYYDYAPGPNVWVGTPGWRGHYYHYRHWHR